MTLPLDSGEVAAMDLITDTKALAALCKALAHETFVTVDTEFMRETTYWPDLCLIQIAGAEVNGLIDPMAEGIDLKPAELKALFDLGYHTKHVDTIFKRVFS